MRGISWIWSLALVVSFTRLVHGSAQVFSSAALQLWIFHDVIPKFYICVSATVSPIHNMLLNLLTVLFQNCSLTFATWVKAYKGHSNILIELTGVWIILLFFFWHISSVNRVTCLPKSWAFHWLLEEIIQKLNSRYSDYKRRACTWKARTQIKM